MHAQSLPSPFLRSITTFIFFLTTFSPSYGQDDEKFSICSSNFYSCGENLPNTGYPFWGGDRPRDCGLPEFGLRCHDESNQTTIEINGQNFLVLAIFENYTMRIARNDLPFSCPDRYYETAWNYTIFRYPDADLNITLSYDCASAFPQLPSELNRFTYRCNSYGLERRGFYWEEGFASSLPRDFGGCRTNITVPVLEMALDEFRTSESMTVVELLDRGFDVGYNIDSTICEACQKSGGFCWDGTNSSQPTCLCDNGPQHLVCPDQGNGRNLWLKIGIGFAAAAFGATLVCVAFFIHRRQKKKRNYSSSWVSRDISSYSSSVTDPEKSGSYFKLHVFNYNELEEATNNFDSSRELGEGGFGTVYKGKLRDGRVVAVKRLYENNFKRVEQFMNEVVILTRLRHQNLVNLYGCTSRHCRELLLVYEYIPNGTVADHLHGGRSRPGSLSWTTRMSIAIETASALAYLHASDVIHRDVKTNNILLDDNFCVKVADFGLSRLFPTDVTHISTAPQGTPGYVDPEYHECYHLTDKSDVYSFGVVLIELISSKPAVDITRHRHEINLSTMAINKIQSNALHELVDPNIGFESDYTIRTTITAVAELAFQCLQTSREMRPTMAQVLEALQGIQTMDCTTGKAEEMEIPADEVVLLKGNAPYSPDSSISRSTTPNASG